MRRSMSISALALCPLLACADPVAQESPGARTSEASPAPGSIGTRFLVVISSPTLHDEVARQLVASGASLEESPEELSLLLAASNEQEFAGRARGISGVVAVIPDVEIPAWSEAMPAEAHLESPSSMLPTDEPLYGLQWGLRAIEAEGAWALGARGGGVRVAIIDAGIDHDHPDLAANVNPTLSRSFVAGLPVFVPPGLLFHHGTIVAGVIGARDNDAGVVGVVPDAELVALRVLGPAGFRWGDVLQAITYAADIEADVVNMSFGTNLPRHGMLDANGHQVASAAEVQEFVKALNRATRYAHDRGVTLVAAAGNAGIDRDHDADRMVLPADLDFVIAIAATTPSGYAYDQATSLDLPASDGNFGRSRIDLSAPGGEFSLRDTRPYTVGPRTFPCVVFDGVLTTVNGGGYLWSTGTSLAAPHVTGVAAMLIGLNGGAMDPRHVRAMLVRTADDIGEPRRDPYHGHGRINARRAVGLMLGRQ